MIEVRGTWCALCMVFRMSLLRDEWKCVSRYYVITSWVSKVKSWLVDRLLRSSICSYSWDRSSLAAPWWSLFTRGLAINWCSSAISQLTSLDWQDTSAPVKDAQVGAHWQPPGYPTIHCYCQMVGLSFYYVHCQTQCPLFHTLLRLCWLSDNFKNLLPKGFTR